MVEHVHLGNYFIITRNELIEQNSPIFLNEEIIYNFNHEIETIANTFTETDHDQDKCGHSESQHFFNNLIFSVELLEFNVCTIQRLDLN